MANQSISLDNMYSYRYNYLMKNIEFYKKSKINQNGNIDDYKIKPEDEEHLMSMMHYFGLDCIKNIYNLLNLPNNSKILDAGSGYAGPARYWVNNLNPTHELTCAELFEDTHKLAIHMTENVVEFRNDLDFDVKDKLKFVNCDLVDYDFGENTFDGIFTVLVILHVDIEKRVQLFKNMFKCLKPGGKMFIECFCFPEITEDTSRDGFTKEKRDKIISICGKSTSFGLLPTRKQYLNHLEQAGFKITQVFDPTEEFKNFTKTRYEKFMENFEQTAEFFGRDLTHKRAEFQRIMAEGFVDGVQGIQILVEK